MFSDSSAPDKHDYEFYVSVAFHLCFHIPAELTCARLNGKAKRTITQRGIRGPSSPPIEASVDLKITSAKLSRSNSVWPKIPMPQLKTESDGILIAKHIRTR